MEWLRKLLGKTSSQPSVTATFRREAEGVYTLWIGGILNKATLDNIQAMARRDIEAGVKNLKVLLFLIDFQGWKRGDDWGDLEFFSRYEEYIAKIAVVGEDRWKEETLLFLGAGRRHGEALYFSKHFAGQAKAWLAQ